MNRASSPFTTSARSIRYPLMQVTSPRASPNMDSHRRHQQDEDEDFNSQPEDKLLSQGLNTEITTLPTQHSAHITGSSRQRIPRPLLIVASVLLSIFLFRIILPNCRIPTRPVFPWTKDEGPKESEDLYLIGAGKADITGPVVEINLMGYADPAQVGTGLRQRLYSRAFIIGSLEHPADRFVYLVLDTQSGDTAVRYGILNALKDLGEEYAVYGKHNVAVTGTHSHAGPGGWLNYLLPQITSKGFDHQGYRAIVDGAILSIRRAHESLTPGYLKVGRTKVDGANINRSLFAYLNNPEEERRRYNISREDDGSVDKDLTLLDFQRASDGKSIGVLTWFATHGTSLLGNNTLIAGDNKGVAAYLFEKSVGGEKENFVAGFSQANVGDTSPNVLGAWCEDGSGQMCSFENSTCSDGKSQACHARGPFFRTKDNGAESCYEIGRRQFESAFELFNTLQETGTPIRGRTVKAFHRFHNMSGYSFLLPNGSRVQTCPAALGYSFAAGTSDGPGAFDFTQHDGNENTTSPVWRVVSGLLKEPTKEQRACHHPKPILLDVGELDKPYQWTPNIVDIQVFKAGQLVIIVSPGEVSTMAGRRWRDAVHTSASSSSSFFRGGISEEEEEEPIVVLGGPANSYTHYITTEEEYAVQRYEGASTLYGPHTLAAYIHVTLSYLPLLRSNPPSFLQKEEEKEEEEEVYPPDNSNRSLSFISPVVRDGQALFSPFGSVLSDVEKLYNRSSSSTNTDKITTTVRATFQGANPRNNLRLEGTYAAVEKLISNSTSSSPNNGASASGGGSGKWEEKEDDKKEKEEWRKIRTDADWDLIFHWQRTDTVLGTSVVEIIWEVDALKGAIPGYEPEAGVYRLRYYGDSRSLGGKITPFEGVSGSFVLV